LRIAQIAALCAGLCRTLAANASRGDDILTVSLGQHIADMGAATSGLLQLSAQAWRVIDVGAADKVETEAAACRSLHRRFLRALFELDPVAIEIAVELGMAARAYERFTDHAIEIAGRVRFAATGEREIRGG
jgi:phosphate uptake regulator